MSLRPPATPLVAHDPYFSIWSAHDRLTDDWPRHWTNAPHPMCGLVRIDGATHRVMGPHPHSAPALEQTALEVTPTRTVYTFEGAGIRLTLTFLTPALPHDLDILARPVTYVTWEAQATDGKSHDVTVYLDLSAEIAVDRPNQHVTWGRLRAPGLSVLRVGSKDQPILEKFGDDLRIDWGHLYLAVPDGQDHATAITTHEVGRKGFARDGRLPETDDMESPRAANRDWPALAATLDLGAVGDAPVARHLMVAYDDIFALEVLERKLRPYWRRNGAGVADLLQDAARDYESLKERCAAFDAEVKADLTAVGGEGYAAFAALAFRQCLAAHKLAADGDGGFVFFSKENYSNGCINTVDVTYPSSPFFLLFNPNLLKAQVGPICEYAASDRWPFPFAPHDMGTYPIANGQVYGGGEKTEDDQMPVEECGNMLILMAALSHVDGNADFARKHWGVLTEWAEYLREKGLDPENQLCTDDFAGHLAHNANLSIKAILGIAGYARMCEMLGEAERAADYFQAAREMAAAWVEKANDGDHYRLAFDRPGTWSQKYNLVWDRLLGLEIFPKDIATTEMAFYRTKLEKYGLPLDNRRTYTKTDWEVWTAILTGNREDFDAIIAPVLDFANETPSRVPMTDWYDTVTAKMVGFQARSVIGGVYIPLMQDPAMWSRWSKRA